MLLLLVLTPKITVQTIFKLSATSVFTCSCGLHVVYIKTIQSVAFSFDPKDHGTNTFETFYTLTLFQINIKLQSPSPVYKDF